MFLANSLFRLEECVAASCGRTEKWDHRQITEAWCQNWQFSSWNALGVPRVLPERTKPTSVYRLDWLHVPKSELSTNDSDNNYNQWLLMKNIVTFSGVSLLLSLVLFHIIVLVTTGWVYCSVCIKQFPTFWSSGIPSDFPVEVRSHV